MMRSFLASILLVAWAGIAAAQLPATLPTITVPPAKPMDLSRAIDRPTLDALHRAELGSLYTPQVAPKLYDAQVLLEKYFASDSATERKGVVRQLESTGLDANVLGRIARIRLYWPRLESGTYYINERVGPHTAIYFMGIPRNYDLAKSWPLVIKLPGAHPFITDPPPTPDQVVQMYTGWIREELTRHPDAVILMPLLNLSELWGPSYKGMNSVIQPLLHLAGRVNIDPRRVCMTGHGMSGHATWNLAIHYPTYFAAINAMSGGAPMDYQRIRLPNLRNIRSVVWHAADDPILDVGMSRDIVKVLRQNKYDIVYEEAPAGGHAPSDEVAERQYQAMCAGARELYPREVVLASNRPDSLFNRADWVQVYQMLASGNERRVRLQLGTGMLRVMENSYSITARFSAPNTIQVKAKNVESMRFYLNDQMVDFTKPITVTVNGPKRFEGIVKPSVEEMLKDQSFLGRGWRYYPAYIDVDFGALAERSPARPTTRRAIAPTR